MATHSWDNLHKIFVFYGIVYAAQLFVPFTLANLSGRVSLYVPYISDCASHFPESGIFSFCLISSSLLNQCIMMLRWLSVENSRNITKTGLFLNSASMMLGSILTLAFIAAACFPTTGLNNVHHTAAGTACMCIVLYMVCQTWLSMKLSPELNASKMRLLLTVLSTTSFIILAVFGVLGSFHWNAEHSVGLKTPKDKGFLYYLISASAEWISALLYFAFICTFFPELRDSVFQFRVAHISRLRKPTLVIAPNV